MAKTDLTKLIESLLRSYDPAEICGQKINKHRTRHTAFEVPVICGAVNGGLVDCVKVYEYFSNRQRENFCRLSRPHGDFGKEWISAMEEGYTCPRSYGIGEKPELCDERFCRFCGVRVTGEMDVLIACYEIKISKADFKSKHGHNFVGNANYYVMPKALYEEVKDLIPEDIGVILYIEGKSTHILRRKKECTFRPLDPDQQKWFILSVLKRIEESLWVDFNRYNARCTGCRYNDTCSKSVHTGDHDEPLTGCAAYSPANGALWF